jgi:outer membrane lipoprotein-sorting protein
MSLKHLLLLLLLLLLLVVVLACAQVLGRMTGVGMLKPKADAETEAATKKPISPLGTLTYTFVSSYNSQRAVQL